VFSHESVRIAIDIQNNLLSVTDNGVGFNEKEFKSFLAPNISFKEGGSTRGNKGVGATYIAYGFNFLQLGTKTPDFSFVGDLKNGRDWIDDPYNTFTRPVVNMSQAIDLNFEEVDRGATFTIKFGGENTRPKNLSWFAASTAEQWIYLLLTKTPLGCLSWFDADSKRLQIKFDLAVMDRSGGMSTLTEIEAQYIYPHDKIKASVNLKEVLEVQEKLLEVGRDPSRLPPKFYKSNGLYEFFNSEDVKRLIPRSVLDDKQALINEYNISAYGYFVHSTSVWDELNDRFAKLRKGYRVLKGGLQLATNRMIQGDMITIPLTSSIGYQNQCHVIVHFKDADPDLGRKGFQPELKDVAESIAVSIVNKFKKRKEILKIDTGAKPLIEKEIELYSWIREQEKHEEENPLILVNENFFAPLHEISITSSPRSEQDVIVTFNQLVAGGVIRGIRLLATRQDTQYDSLYKFVVREPFDNHVFDKEHNPLGFAELQYSSEIVSQPKVLEYKFNLDALIREFENEEKKEKDIDLVVTWEMGEEWRKNYEATSLLDLDNLHHREFHGLTHILRSASSRLNVIALSELFDYLNDVHGVQTFQRRRFGEEMF
jgi:hypothetical protein